MIVLLEGHKLNCFHSFELAAVGCHFRVFCACRANYSGRMHHYLQGFIAVFWLSGGGSILAHEFEQFG